MKHRSQWFCKYKIAHRGLHNDKYPENSLGAFQNAIDYGVAIELDVRVIKDGNIVVFHDSNLKRMCGTNKDVHDLTTNELDNCKLNNSEYIIPTLKEVLELVHGQVPIMIELKGLKKADKLEEKVYNLIKHYHGDLAVKSFNPFSMIWFRKNAPKVLRGMLSSYFTDTYLPSIYKFLLKRLSFYNLIKPDFISYRFLDLPNKYVTKKKVPVITWTIDSKEQEAEALKVANNVIFEDYIPDKAQNY